MTKPLILLVDDEAHITHVMSRAVQSAGFEAMTAEDGEEAYEVACERRPTLIVTDLQMPYMSGIDLAKRLNEHHELGDVPVILLSARGYVVSEDAGGLKNIRMIIEKPFSAKNVMGHIRDLIGGDESGRTAA